MREIKFRAWDKERNEMRYGFEGQIDWEFRDDYPLMQYTGLKDKNGKEIYEGDIIQLWKDKIKAYKVEIKWNDHYLGYEPWCQYIDGLDSPEQWGYEMEVIGNIYENPELLK